MPSKILVVDDDILVAGYMADTLQDLGHDVQEAYSGPEALDILRCDDGYDCVITDLNMPGMTGFELCDRVKRSHPHLTVMLVTADIIGASATACDMLVLAKPYCRHDLASLLDRHGKDQATSADGMGIPVRSGDRACQSLLI